MNRRIVITGIVLGLLAVIIGAFGAHGLKGLVSEVSAESFETGVRYQMYHALLLLWLGSSAKIPEAGKKWAYYSIVTGVLLFSFSIYGLATDNLTPIPFKSVAFITPIGGVFLLLGWMLIGYRVYRYLD